MRVKGSQSFRAKVGRFVIVFVNRNAQAIGIDAEPLFAGQELPAHVIASCLK